jgi:oligopeptide transport system permease protein
VNPLARRVLRDLSLVPLVALLVYEFVAHLPVRRDDDAKREVSSAVQRELEDRLCVHDWDGFLCPWRDLVDGRALAGDAASDLYDGPMILAALGGSLRMGLLALVIALVAGAAFALVRVTVRSRAARTGLEAVPALVYATPTFLLGLFVASFTGVSFDDEKRPYELVAALVMSVGPAAFVGVVLHDALVAESQKGYFTVARAKGLSRAAALRRHALPNALPALLDAFPPVATALLAGSFVVERLFNVTYLGFLYVEAARQKQLGVVVVTTTLFAALLVLVSLGVELVRLRVDPRARARALQEDA